MSLRKVEKIVNGMPTTDGAGVSLVRFIGTHELDMLDPFLMLDAFRSDDPNDYIAGFPSHPHRGFETVTYLHAGRMRHKDSAGNEGVIEPGGVQWMSAGRGIVHSEMPEQADGLLSGFQLWVNLPASDKMSPPSYQEFPPADVPVETRNGIRLTVVAGKTREGTEGPVKQVLTEPQYMDVELAAGAVFREDVPSINNGFLLVAMGSLTVATDVDETTLQADQLAILGSGDAINVSAGDHGARFLLISGRPIGESVARAGPFVMNTHSELRQAFADYQSGNFV
jgi:quercetin 2,3-dioxygenase